MVCWSPWWLWCILEITDDSCQLIQEVLNPHTNTQISIECRSALWAEQVTAQNLLVYISFTPISYFTWRISERSRLWVWWAHFPSCRHAQTGGNKELTPRSSLRVNVPSIPSNNLQTWRNKRIDQWDCTGVCISESICSIIVCGSDPH